MNMKEMRSQAGAAEALLKAVGNRYRLMVLCELNSGERSVGALQRAVGLSQSALSQHLARPRADGLVATRRDAQTIFYSLAGDRVGRLISLLYELYCSTSCAPAARPPKRSLKP